MRRVGIAGPVNSSSDNDSPISSIFGRSNSSSVGIRSPTDEGGSESGAEFEDMVNVRDPGVCIRVKSSAFAQRMKR